MKMKYRNSANTVTGLVMSIIIVMTIFSGLYLYFGDQVIESGQTIDSKYSDVNSNVTEIGTSLDNNVQNIVGAWDDITQADNLAFAVWNSFTGLGLVLKLPFSFLDDATNLAQQLFAPLSILPGWVISFAFIALTAYIILLLLKVLKGEPNL